MTVKLDRCDLSDQRNNRNDVATAVMDPVDTMLCITAFRLRPFMAVLAPPPPTHTAVTHNNHILKYLCDLVMAFQINAIIQFQETLG